MMTIQDEVTEADLIAVPSDFSSGDLVYIHTQSPPVFGIVTEASEEKMVIYCANDRFLFDAGSTPTLAAVLRHINKTIPARLIKAETILSRIIELPDGKVSREYAKIVKADLSEIGDLETVTLSVLNGVDKDKIYTLSDDAVSSVVYKLSSWEVED